MTELIPLCVPRADEHEALTLGALTDPVTGIHLAADQFRDPFWKWLPRMYDPQASRPVLIPEMLPVATWEQNVRHLLGTEAWDRMRKHAYRSAGFRCEICGDNGRLEAHEAWYLANETCVQKLVRILALCPLCHKAHHLGIARRLGMLPAVQLQLKRVNRWTERQLIAAIGEAYDVWEQRCDMPWTVDLSWLYRSGYIHV